jgi:putative transposase
VLDVTDHGADGWVIDALEQARRQYGLPTTIRVDQGSQFRSKELDLWAYTNGVTLDFSRPGKPTDNAYLESFNATVRLQRLGQHWLLDLDDARDKVEEWRIEYNEVSLIAQSVTGPLYP